MAAWEPPINPFTGSPETPDARLPPSLRPRMGKGRADVLLAADVNYYSSAIPALIATVDACLRPGGTLLLASRAGRISLSGFIELLRMRGFAESAEMRAIEKIKKKQQAEIEQMLMFEIKSAQLNKEKEDKILAMQAADAREKAERQARIRDAAEARLKAEMEKVAAEERAEKNARRLQRVERPLVVPVGRRARGERRARAQLATQLRRLTKRAIACLDERVAIAAVLRVLCAHLLVVLAQHRVRALELMVCLLHVNPLD